MKNCRLLHRLRAWGLGIAFAFQAGSAVAEISPFVLQVQPILEEKCYSCHGSKSQQSGYRLDVREVALAGGDSGVAAIVPGRAIDSPLIQFVQSHDEDVRMPPGDSGVAPLNAVQIEVISAWIDAGAVWPDTASTTLPDPLDWWSLQRLPKPSSEGSKAHSIDAFVSAKLAEHGLVMAPETDKRTLCRRLYFDLVGLPPSPEEIDSFEQAASVDSEIAIADLVTQLLDSPRYGERWARHWLDVVHYGDTHGYDKDQPRPNAWPYRDYVIRSLNDDKPYGQFVQEQLAGDVLFPGTRDGIEALGFIAAGPWDFIGHAEVPETKIDGKIARHLDRDDMLGNAIGTLCSTTLQCAQCHNHKFDPITQEDYYSVQAVFAAIDRADRPYDADADSARVRAELIAEKQQWETKRKAFDLMLVQAGGPELEELNKQIALAQSASSNGSRPEYGWHSAIEATADVSKWVQVDLGDQIEIDRIELVGAWDDFNGIGAGFGFPVRFRIEVSQEDSFALNAEVISAFETQDYSNPGTKPQTFAASGRTARYVRITASKLAPRLNDYIVAIGELLVFDAAGTNVALKAKVTSTDSIEAPIRWARVNLTDGIYSDSGVDNSKLAALLEQREALVSRVTSEETRKSKEETGRILNAVSEKMAALPPVQFVYAGTVHQGSGAFSGTGASGGTPRPIFLLGRGQVTSPGREVGPGALSVFDQPSDSGDQRVPQLPSRFMVPADQPEGMRRAALARWITDNENPLTWRSIVNRVWHYHFGRGIVETPNDFGRMGAVPTHPELLDWLAADFRDHGGSLKRLHRQIVTSAAYRQSSTTDNAEASKMDPGNAWLWRQHRRKLEAEAIRDAVLFVSGTLDLSMGGPGWQDFIVTNPAHSPHYEYALSDPNDSRVWRRSIYRFIVRSQTQPFMTSLDCADPSTRVEKRNESVSPSQALTLMNNGFMVTHAAHFAARVEEEAGPSMLERVDYAYRLALGHVPTSDQRQRLAEFAQKHGTANLCRVLFNLNEFSFVD